MARSELDWRFAFNLGQAWQGGSFWVHTALPFLAEWFEGCLFCSGFRYNGPYVINFGRLLVHKAIQMLNTAPDNKQSVSTTA